MARRVLSPAPEASACRDRPAERVGRAFMALVLGVSAVAASNVSVVLAIALGLAATLPALGALTGRCPVTTRQLTGLLRRRRSAPVGGNFIDARRVVRIDLRAGSGDRQRL